MLTAKKPFNAESAAALVYKHIHDEIPLLPRHLRAYQPLIDRLMAKQPQDRFQTAEELALVVTQQLG
jgi:serine/threonine-protein kinase PpkA